MPRRRTKLTAETINETLKMLEANKSYKSISRQLKISMASIGRIRSAANGKITPNNEAIARLMGTKTTPIAEGQKLDTQGLAHTIEGFDKKISECERRVIEIDDLLAEIDRKIRSIAAIL